MCFEGWIYESHYRGQRTGFHTQNPNQLMLNFFELDDSRFYKDFQLNPNTRYKASVHAIGEDIVAQNDCGGNISVLGDWNHSSEFDNERGSFEGNLTVSFRTKSDGKIRLSCRLGFWCSEAKGKIIFTNFQLEEDFSKIVLGTDQVRFETSIDNLEKIDLVRIEWWLEQNNTAYKQMFELYGTCPFNNEILYIESRFGINAYAFTGNPIVWNEQCMLDYFLSEEETFSANFGIFHEIGHTYDQTALSKINCELMANFGLCYAVENGNLKIYFDNELTYGRGLQDGFYKRAYEGSIKIGKYHHDGLLYCILYCVLKIQSAGSHLEF